MIDLQSIGIIHFKERYYRKIWGGQRLREKFGKETPTGEPVGEAWLVSDHPCDESQIDEEPLAGKSLQDLLQMDSIGLLGSVPKATVHGRFPLLLKLIDASDWLSVQVHPDDEIAASLGEPDVGKTEMWHVIAADRGAELICGLREDLTPERFVQAVEDGTIEQIMVRFGACEGVSAFVPAGTVHAIGAGIVLAEIQQNSDLTYRIYDWGRVQDDGKPRELHIEKARQAVHFGSSHTGPVHGLCVAHEAGESTVLAACRYFAAERIEISGRYTRTTNHRSFHLLLSLTSGLQVSARSDHRLLKRGESVLIPGSVPEYTVAGNGAYLLYYVPDLREDILAPLLHYGYSWDEVVRLGGDRRTSDLAIVV